MEYLDFELPIKELEDQLTKCQVIEKKVMLMLLQLVRKLKKN